VAGISGPLTARGFAGDREIHESASQAASIQKKRAARSGERHLESGQLEAANVIWKSGPLEAANVIWKSGPLEAASVI
jgi:hypothetical protein